MTADDHDVNVSYLNNDSKSYHSKVVDIATLAMQNQSFIWSFHMTMWNVHMNNECMTACLIQLSACSSNDIDALINPGGKEVTYLWPMVMMKPMALYVIYPGSCGPFQYSEGYVKIAALKLICVTYTN